MKENHDERDFLLILKSEQKSKSRIHISRILKKNLKNYGNTQLSNLGTSKIRFNFLLPLQKLHSAEKLLYDKGQIFFFSFERNTFQSTSQPFSIKDVASYTVETVVRKLQQQISNFNNTNYDWYDFFNLIGGYLKKAHLRNLRISFNFSNSRVSCVCHSLLLE